MILMSIGTLIFSIAFFILVVYLSRTLKHLSSVIMSMNRTIEKLPNQVDGITNEATTLLWNTNKTVDDLNKKLGTLTPYFYIAGDFGDSTKYITSSFSDIVQATAEKPERKNLGLFKGLVSASYLLLQKVKRKTKN
ncbi:DUF948 domain-containing protein [Pueribacillus theae]|uniref:DUF948 domain-containing protein n=1 Tax=Pueribacillus theae TaxID=2171751 RepID=A0A2U1JII4_9BACI|nr:DUF948 domain-containing protein [Pueribacillus theae]PWA04980.1 DUF948 domain-containing protein [Pueribacillus theae]